MPLIPEETIDDIRARADIVAVIGQHVKLRKAGNSHKGLCPFHSEKSPSFSVNSDKGFFYCFGCQKKGDVFTFLMEYEGKTFHEACEQLAQVTGVTLPAEADRGGEERRSAKGEMLRVNAAAAAFFRAELAGPRGQAARGYLAERGVGDDIAADFRLGYAPDDWRALGDHLVEQRVSLELAETLGLIGRQPRAGGHYDKFRHRLVCPVIQPGGDVVGFSARTLPGCKTHTGDDAPAKYINSPESPLYKKSRLLFGIHRAQAGFRKKNRAVLVEGNFDVVSLHQAGIEEAVAPLGTALTDEQVDILRRYVPVVVLLYDGDGAGRAATVKSLKLLVAADLEVRIASLPTGEDPDSIARKGGPAAVLELVDGARPGVEYFIYEVWGRTRDSTDGRASAMAEAADVLRSVPVATKRDLWVGQFAASLQLEVGVVRQGLRRALESRGADSRTQGTPLRDPRQGTEGQSPEIAVAAPLRPPPQPELETLAILADHPSLLEVAEQRDLLSLLTDSRLRDMYSAAREGQAMWWSAPSADRAMTQTILAGGYSKVADPTRCLENAISYLRRTRTTELASRLQREIEQAQRRGDAERSHQLSQELWSLRKQVD
jgi:DNA primase